MLLLGVIVCYSMETNGTNALFFMLFLGVIVCYSIEITGTNISLWVLLQ
jgi:hypothetical protein